MAFAHASPDGRPLVGVWIVLIDVRERHRSGGEASIVSSADDEDVAVDGDARMTSARRRKLRLQRRPMTVKRGKDQSTFI